jgi:hypothetical protein
VPRRRRWLAPLFLLAALALIPWTVYLVGNCRAGAGGRLGSGRVGPARQGNQLDVYVDGAAALAEVAA